MDGRCDVASVIASVSRVASSRDTSDYVVSLSPCRVVRAPSCRSTRRPRRTPALTTCFHSCPASLAPDVTSFTASQLIDSFTDVTSLTVSQLMIDSFTELNSSTVNSTQNKSSRRCSSRQSLGKNQNQEKQSQIYTTNAGKQTTKYKITQLIVDQKHKTITQNKLKTTKKPV